MRNEPETAAAAFSSTAAHVDAEEHAPEEIEERALAVGRKLSRSWLPRLAAVAAGLIAAGLARRRTAAHRSRAR